MLNILDNFVRQLLSSWSTWRQRQRAYAELYALDDRALADIGISRAEIPFVLTPHASAAAATLDSIPANSNVQHAA